MTIDEILKLDGAESIISALKKKSIVIPAWEGEGGLRSQYDPKMHPVMDETIYPNIMDDDGHVDYVPRITLGFQKLAAKRMTELIIVSRVYKPENDNQQAAHFAERLAVWRDAAQKRSVKSIRVEGNRVIVEMALPVGADLTLTYAVNSDGRIKVDMDYQPKAADIPLIPKFGMRMRLPADFNLPSWASTRCPFPTMRQNT